VALISIAKLQQNKKANLLKNLKKFAGKYQQILKSLHGK
tara:strand:- start:1355 stop:1471 length:117 start_codon:yes stop_codon:yes gene_type:complete